MKLTTDYLRARARLDQLAAQECWICAEGARDAGRLRVAISWQRTAADLYESARFCAEAATWRAQEERAQDRQRARSGTDINSARRKRGGADG